MKKAFNVLRSPRVIDVTVTRQSVSAGDDVYAPHEKKIQLPPFTDPEVLAMQISGKYDLPSIYGGRATWICTFNKKEIAVLAQQWKEAKPLCTAVVFEENNEAHFIYYAQIPPEILLEADCEDERKWLRTGGYPR